MLLRVLSVVVAAGAVWAATSVSEVASQAKPLDFEAFKTRIEPIFLEKREGHVRCYTCHSENNSAFHLERLSGGSNSWTDEQSRKNFQSVSGLVAPNNPATREIDLQPNEILTEIVIPSGGRKNATYEVRQKEALDWPLATASVALRVRQNST